MNGSRGIRTANRYVVDRAALAGRLSDHTEGLPDVLAGWLPWAVAGAVRDGAMDCVPYGPARRSGSVVDLRLPALPVEDDLYRETIRYVCEYLRLLSILAPQNADPVSTMPFHAVAKLARSHFRKIGDLPAAAG